MKAVKKPRKQTRKRDALLDELQAIADRFEKHMPSLIANLRHVRQQGPTIQPFDEKDTVSEFKDALGMLL